MPAPRAVLADIHEFKLDHNVAHSSIKASGRLKSIPEQQLEEVVTEKVVETATVVTSVEVIEVAEVAEAVEETNVASEHVVEQVVETTEVSSPTADSSDLQLDSVMTEDVSMKKSKRNKKDSAS